MNNDSQIAIYTAQNGETEIDVTMREDTIWLTQDTMARLWLLHSIWQLVTLVLPFLPMCATHPNN